MIVKKNYTIVTAILITEDVFTFSQHKVLCHLKKRNNNFLERMCCVPVKKEATSSLELLCGLTWSLRDGSCPV